jgi:hypothetical protein
VAASSGQQAGMFSVSKGRAAFSLSIGVVSMSGRRFAVPLLIA